MTMEYEIHCSFYIFINIYLYENYEPYDTGFTAYPVVWLNVLDMLIFDNSDL